MADGTVPRNDLPPNVLNLAGLAFARMTAITYTDRYRKNAGWICRCQCGAVKAVRADHLLQGRVRSCGCLQRELAAQTPVVHGQARRRQHTREYKTWMSMRSRCRDKHARRYGGRGIRVCARWDVFENFFADMGTCPEAMTIDRIDCNGPYAPENCRWATMHTQNRNRSSNRMLTFNGVTRCLTDWAHMVGITRGALVSRIDRDWPIEKALQTPRRKQTAHITSLSRLA